MLPCNVIVQQRDGQTEVTADVRDRLPASSIVCKPSLGGTNVAVDTVDVASSEASSRKVAQNLSRVPGYNIVAILWGAGGRDRPASPFYRRTG